MREELSDKILGREVREEKVLVADPDSRNYKLYEALIGGVNRRTGHNYVPIIVSTIDEAKKVVDENSDIERAIISVYFSKDTISNSLHFKPTGMDIVDYIRSHESLINAKKHPDEHKISIPIIATAAPILSEKNTNFYRQIAIKHDCDMFLDIPFVAVDFLEAMNMLKLPVVDTHYIK